MKKPKPIFESNAEALLAVKLFELRNTSSSSVAVKQQEAMDVIFALVVAHGDDQDFKNKFVEMNAMETILNVTKHSTTTTSPLVLHCAAGIFVEVVGDSPERATAFLNAGGLDSCLDTLQMCIYSESFIATSYMAVLVMMLYVLRKEQREPFCTQIFETVVQALEANDCQCGDLYQVACCSLGLSSSRVEVPFPLVQRAIQCTFDGVVIFKDHEYAQEIGRHLLVYFLGVDGALPLIHHAEMHHCEDATCSCAA